MTFTQHPIGAVIRHPRVRQLVRYGAVSIVATLTSMIVLGTLVSTRALPATWANVTATAVGTIPSFELNRRWVWGKTGQRSLAAEVGPFVALSFAGLALSTLTVAAADHWASGAHLSSLARTCVVEGASLAAFGSLWLAQFAILDKLLFRSTDRIWVTQVPIRYSDDPNS
jgi:putative flippase GtrA